MSSTVSTDRRLCLLWWIAINLPFVIGHPGWPWTPEPLLQSLAVNLVLFILPGLAACGWRRSANRPVPLTLLLMILVSFAVFLGLLLLFQSGGWPITAITMWNGTWAVSNLLAVAHIVAVRKTVFLRQKTASVRREPPDLDAGATTDLSPTGGDSRKTAIQREWVAALLFATTYGLYFHAAMRVVPPQPDHDLEVQGTGFGLIHRMEPLLLTDRGPHYYFAHPLLLHFYVGESFLYYDQIEQLRPYDEASQRVRTVRDGRSVAPPSVQLGEHRVVGLVGQDYLLKAPGSPPIRLPVDEVEIELIDSYYALLPGRLETRTPSVFLAALTVALMGWWAAGLSGHWWMGLLAAAAYATSPEVYVRSSYGGYFAISNFLVLCMLMAAASWDRRRKERIAWWTCVLAGLLAGLANHKLVLLPLSLALVAVLRSFRSRESWKSVVHPALVGFVAGTALFWGHGFLVDAAAFWKEHVRTHLVDRVIHINPLGYSGYPTVTGLWAEFSEHTGYALLPLGLLALLLGVFRQQDARNPSAAEPSPNTENSSPGLTFPLTEKPCPCLTPTTLRAWAVWMAVTAVVYSLVDWRMTKHLSPLLIPLHVAPANWSGSGWMARIFVATIFAGLLIWNLMVLRTVMADFHALTITPAW